MILLYSSDHYPVFKRDVFAITSLPEGYCYHFRYQEKYVSQDIRNGLNPEGRSALIIFVKNNSQNSATLELIPIRLATIVKMIRESQTGLYHVYFQLRAFADVDQSVLSSFNDHPPTVYLGNEVINPFIRGIQWIQVIRKIENSGNGLFFNIRVEDSSRIVVNPLYDLMTFEPYYQINDESTHLIRFSISDCNLDKAVNEVCVKIEGTDIRSSLGDTLNTSLDVDDQIFNVYSLALGDARSSANILKISTKSKDTQRAENDYSVRILFNVKKDINRFRSFFFLSALIFLGGGMLTLNLQPFVDSTGWQLAIKFIGLFVTSIGAAWLFFRFNKK